MGFDTTVYGFVADNLISTEDKIQKEVLEEA
jgi:hypothetical protein